MYVHNMPQMALLVLLVWLLATTCYIRLRCLTMCMCVYQLYVPFSKGQHLYLRAQPAAEPFPATGLPTWDGNRAPSVSCTPLTTPRHTT
jgi:hypothetical protein